MKVSKRFLSIFLMLAMLVGMFTVLASAADDKVQITFNVGSNGTVSIGNEKIKSKTYTFDKADVNAKYVAVSPKAGYVATVKIGDDELPQEVANNGFSLLADYDGKMIKVSFAKKSTSQKPDEPEKDPEDSYKLRIGVQTNGVKGAKILYKGTEVDTTKAVWFTKADLAAGVTLTASADDANFKVKWTLDDKPSVENKTFTFSTLKDDADNSSRLIVEFTADTEPEPEPDTKNTLTVATDNATMGLVKYGVNKTASLEFDLEKNEKVTVEAVANDGYEFKEWKVTGKASVSSTSATATTITMGDADATVTAKFVKKETSEDLRKMTITASGYGKVQFKVNNDVNWTTVNAEATISGLKKGDTVKVKATPDDGYAATWKVNGTKQDYEDTHTFTIRKSDYKVNISFTDTDTRKVKLDIDGASHGDVEWKLVGRDDDFVTAKQDSYRYLSKNGKLKVSLDPDSGYKVAWQLGSGETHYTESFTIEYDDVAKKGSTLYVEFYKKGSNSNIDNGYPTLTFDITGGKHGTVTRNNGYKVSDGDVISIKKNESRTFKADPDKGYVAVWTLSGETYVGNSFTMKMGSKDVTLYIEFMDEDDYRLTKLPFRDVSEKDWYYDDVVYVYRNGYMDGISSTKFGGNMNTTRGQIVTILWRLTGEPRAAKKNQFNDVSSRQYYYDAISWAAEAGIVDGFDAKTFKPDANVTREQLAAILYRYAEYMNLSTRGAANLTKFSDYYEIGTWARDAMAWANYHGLINGTDYYHISPKGYATRAQIAAILHRFAVEFGA